MATAFHSVSNMAATTLAADITDSATSLTVATGTGAEFPASGKFYVVIVDTRDDLGRPASYEIVEVQSRSTDTFTLTGGRGSQGTSAAAHSEGAAVELAVTASQLTELQTAVNGIEAGTTTLTSAATSGDMTCGGDLAVNGGDMTSTASTVNMFAASSIVASVAGKGLTVRGRLILNTITAFTADDTTPAVNQGSVFTVPGTWTAGHDITMFDSGATGQLVVILGGDSDCNVVDGGHLKLAGNWSAAAGATLTLLFDGTDWYELCRSAT